MADPRGLLIDFGGVLTTSIRDAFLAFCERERVDAERLRVLLRRAYDDADPESFISKMETGRIPGEEFERLLAEAFSEGRHAPVSAEGLMDRMLHGLDIDAAMVEVVREIRSAGARTALLSNSWGLDIYPRELLAELFDDVVISGEVGLRKPHPEVFHLALERIDLPAGACVFVDDAEPNIRTAEGIGMVGVLHEETPKTIAVLRTLFRGALSGPGNGARRLVR